MVRAAIIGCITLSLVCTCCAFSLRNIKSEESEKEVLLRELVEDLKDEEKRTEHAHGIVFFFGDLDRNSALTEVELRRLFSGNVFAAHLEDLIRVLMSRDLDNSQSLDVHEWEDIESMSRGELALMLMSMG